MHPEPEPIDLEHATDRDYRALAAFWNAIEAERFPDDPPKSLERLVASWRHLPPHLERWSWVIRGDDRAGIVAYGRIAVQTDGQNRHAGYTEIAVLPECRRRGLGCALLSRITDVAVQQDRGVLFGWTFETVPAGETFAECFGAERGSEGHVNRLDLRSVDRAMLETWTARASTGAFELVFTDTAFEEAMLEAVADLQTALFNDVPLDRLQLEEERITPERLRAHEHRMAAQGTVRWALLARERQTGALVGYTEVFYHPENPDSFDQNLTGVLGTHRRQGLGRWLKAAMLERILRDRPDARWVDTGNADSNGPMLRINLALGFRPYSSLTTWQAATDAVQDRLASSGVRR